MTDKEKLELLEKQKVELENKIKEKEKKLKDEKDSKIEEKEKRKKDILQMRSNADKELEKFMSSKNKIIVSIKTVLLVLFIVVSWLIVINYWFEFCKNNIINIHDKNDAMLLGSVIAIPILIGIGDILDVICHKIGKGAVGIGILSRRLNRHIEEKNINAYKEKVNIIDKEIKNLDNEIFDLKFKYLYEKELHELYNKKYDIRKEIEALNESIRWNSLSEEEKRKEIEQKIKEEERRRFIKDIASALQPMVQSGVDEQVKKMNKQMQDRYSDLEKQLAEKTKNVEDSIKKAISSSNKDRGGCLSSYNPYVYSASSVATGNCTQAQAEMLAQLKTINFNLTGRDCGFSCTTDIEEMISDQLKRLNYNFSDLNNNK